MNKCTNTPGRLFSRGDRTSLAKRSNSEACRIDQTRCTFRTLPALPCTYVHYHYMIVSKKRGVDRSTPQYIMYKERMFMR